jgi:hypothetical protein
VPPRSVDFRGLCGVMFTRSKHSSLLSYSINYAAKCSITLVPEIWCRACWRRSSLSEWHSCQRLKPELAQIQKSGFWRHTRSIRSWRFWLGSRSGWTCSGLDREPVFWGCQNILDLEQPESGLHLWIPLEAQSGASITIRFSSLTIFWQKAALFVPGKCFSPV